MKTPLKVHGKSRIRAQFAEATAMFAAGVLNVISKFQSKNEKSDFYLDDIATVNIGTSPNFNVMAADIRGAYQDWFDGLKAEAKTKAEPLWVDANGKKLDDKAQEGYVNPKLKFEVVKGTLLIAK